MKMYLGKLMSTPDDNVYEVITGVTGKRVSKKEPLQDFIAKQIMVEYAGEFRSIKEVLDMQCEEYKKKHEVLF